MATEPSPGPAGTVELDAQHPWPGLLAYEEASRDFFHGRADEAEELLRLIRRAPLTVLYGKSGLGKSSLLQAGLFPLLRVSHYLPVYCRLDFSVRATDGPLEQVAQRLGNEIHLVSAEYPTRGSGEGLWEYLHRSAAEIWSRDNFPLTPVLVLDQFEELFSPSGGGAERIAHVFDDLADLIENRIPGELASDAATARRARLDLQSQRYRIILSFREDYLPEVKTWEKKVPSLLRNYLRLEPMTRRRAIAAVERAGAAVVEAGAAPAIVDFVGKLPATAQSTDQDRAIIEPALLSLFCYKLNLRRQATKIDQALIAGSGQDILDHFYREALEADDVTGPPDVATFIQDHLVQGDRYRGAYPKIEALEAGLLTAGQLDALTARHRLLRVVQHADTTRIELIHDCLVPVVCRARDERKNKEAQAELRGKATEAEARAREKAKYNRWLIGLAVGLVGVLLWAVSSRNAATQAAKRAMTNAAIGGSYRAHEDDLRTLLAVQALSLAGELDDRTAAARAADQLRRAMNSRLIWSSPAGKKVNVVAFTPDGRNLAAASGRQLRIWDVATGKEEPPQELIEHLAEIRDIAFTPDGTLVAADSSGAVRLWNIQTGDEKSPPDPMKHEPAIPGPDGAIKALAPGPRNLLATGTGEKGSIVLWDLSTGKRIGLPFGQRDDDQRWFFDLSLTVDGSRLAAADVGSAGETTVWDVSAPANVEAPVALFSLRNWRMDEDPTEDPTGIEVNSVAFSQDGKLLATGDRDNAANLWDGESGEHRGTLTGHMAPVRKVAFNRDGSRLATASEDSEAAVWDTATRKQLFRLEGHGNLVMDVEFSPDGHRLATAGGKDETVKVWSAEAHTGVVYGVAFSQDNNLLATAGDDRTIRFWNVESRVLVARLEGHKDHVYRVAFSPDGKRLASASFDGTAKIWDLSTEQEVLSLRPDDEDDKIYDVDYSPDGKWLATAGANFSAVVWDAATGQRRFTGRHEGTVNAVAFSRDGGFLASAGGDGLMKFWDVSSGDLVACAKGPAEGKNSPYGLRWFLDVNFSPDGNDLVIATGQSSVSIVDGWRSQLVNHGAGTASGDVDRACKGGVLLEAKHLSLVEKDTVKTAQFTPDGTKIVTTGSRHQVAIRDRNDGKRQNEVRVHFRGAVNQVAFSRDGLWIATASKDGTFHVSPLATGDLRDRTCERLAQVDREPLTPEECKEYLGTDECPPPPCDEHR